MATAKKSIRGIDLSKMEAELRETVLEISVDILDTLTQKIADEAQRLAPVISSETHPNFETRRGVDKSTALKESIYWMESKKVALSNLVISPKWYSHFVEFGTDPHTITPDPKSESQQLAFPKNGKVIVAKKVNHPGVTKPQPFLRTAEDKAETFLKQILAENGLKSK